MFKQYKESKIDQTAHQTRFMPRHVACVECGTTFVITPQEQQFASEGKGFVLPKRCPKCREKRRMAEKALICKTCGKLFTFKAGEQEFYKEHGLANPKKCPVCRKIKSGGTKDGEGSTKAD